MMQKRLCHFFLVLILVLLLLTPVGPLHASVERKIITLWGKTVSYEKVLINKKHLDYDGLSFVIPKKGAKPAKARVVINKAYFAKEAHELWDSFEEGEIPDYDLSVDLMSFLDRLLRLDETLKNKGALDSLERTGLLTELKTLKKQLQYSAWHNNYATLKREFSSPREAKRSFVRLFEKTREQAIEVHEASHLMDALAGPSSVSAHDTEVSAFLTELVYGDNPQDVLWQMVTGVVDELNKGKTIDFSIQKFKDVLVSARKLPWVKKEEELCFLCFLSKDQTRLLAQWAYRKRLVA